MEKEHTSPLRFISPSQTKIRWQEAASAVALGTELTSRFGRNRATGMV